MKDSLCLGEKKERQLASLSFARFLNRNAVAPRSPGLAASATLGSRMKKPFNRNAVESFLGESKTGATALRLKTNETRHLG